MVRAAVVQAAPQRRRAPHGGDARRRTYLLTELLTDYLSKLREDLLFRSNVSIPAGERLQAAISVPANASSAQRFLTLDAFQRAGFDAVSLLNEPSAAGFEFARRHRTAGTAKRES